MSIGYYYYRPANSLPVSPWAALMIAIARIAAIAIDLDVAGKAENRLNLCEMWLATNGDEFMHTHMHMYGNERNEWIDIHARF